MSLDTGHKPLILAALRSGDTLTNLDILNRFGCMNGKGRISELRQEGWDIQGKFIEVKNRFGETVRVMEYSIPPESREKPLESKIVKKPNPIPEDEKSLIIDSFRVVPGIYGIYCKPENRYYIGASGTVFARLQAHLYGLRSGNHQSYNLQTAWDKYGETEFIFGLIEETTNLMEREEYYLVQLGKDKLYNVDPISTFPKKPMLKRIIRKPRKPIGQVNSPRAATGRFKKLESSMNKPLLIEALKVYFLQGKNAFEAAATMGVSQPTFTRICQRCNVKLRDKSELPIPDTVAYLAAMDALRVNQAQGGKDAKND